MPARRRLSTGPGVGRQPAPTRRARADVPRLRVLWLVVLAMFLASTVWMRLAYWQVVQHGYLRHVADALHVADVTLPATRGVISDSHGRALAVNVTVYDVSLSPPQHMSEADKEEVANALAASLGEQPDQIMQTLNSGAKFSYVAKRIPKDKADQIQNQHLTGVTVQGVPQRTYLPGATPNSTLASGLLGFVNYAGQGQSGVEGYYNELLGGRDGHQSLYRDPAGDVIPATTQLRQEPVEGQNLQLTIDSDAQYVAEQALASGVQANHAEGGSVLIMDTKTGGIAGWASYPTYDANQFAHLSASSLRDPMAEDLYEPGSVMKVVTLAGAMDAGAITPDTTIQDPGYVDVEGSRIRDWDDAAHGTVTMTKVLEDSLNVGAVKAQQAEGRANYLRYLKAFGFGQPSKVGVAAEASRPLPQNPSDVTLATNAFGQGIAVNVVQMTAAVNAIANGGVYVQPHVAQKVGDKEVVPEQRRVIKPDTAEKMKTMMRQVVQHGSGWKARVGGFELDQAGKTGSSQIPENGKYSKWYWASYVGFLPAENPRYTMMVMLKKPNNGSPDANEGYATSAPIWKDISQQLILQDRITPENLPALPGGTTRSTG
jgi:cell division protein FtsI/penicillin-binding protein 2